MLFDSNALGSSKEGTADNPLVVHGCTVETFANFLGWLNHKYVSSPSIFQVTLY